MIPHPPAQLGLSYYGGAGRRRRRNGRRWRRRSTLPPTNSAMAAVSRGRPMRGLADAI
jgi:hypothetical protein